ncbi:MAG: hypothetical protein CMJ25_26355 [Phycisphaerae bacterium]|nr:hypothetical protein [Phycisphaerae bacterium]|tara:strand:+ start:689 stop:901 length:213 start_codon:yes stop_codon:yes gene_type:complete
MQTLIQTLIQRRLSDVEKDTIVKWPDDKYAYFFDYLRRHIQPRDMAEVSRLRKRRAKAAEINARRAKAIG